MSRIKLEMTVIDILQELCEGNPGAITACMELMAASPKVDPQAWAKDLQPLLQLDELKIYGSDIWLLYKDLCGQDSTKVLTLFRAQQLGMITAVELKAAMHNPNRFSEEMHANMLLFVKSRVSKFAQN
jgi:hypothetical protein